MLARKEFLNSHPDLSEGMPVYSTDGEKLGKITAMSDDWFTVEKGIFFPKDFTARYDDIQDIRDGTVYLNYAQKDLTDWRNDSYQGWSNVTDINEGRMKARPLDEYRDRYSGFEARGDNVQNIPVVEEQLEAQKTMRQAGEVKVRKIVHTELKHFTVPVTREEVRVERVPVEAGQVSANANVGGAFKEDTISVPVMEEEVTVTKRPVVREEVRVTKERHTEEREVEGEIRKEEVQVDEPDRIKKAV